MTNKKKQFCRKGHNISITGRDSSGHCIECRKEHSRIYYIEHKEKIDDQNKQYAENHQQEIKEYNKQRNSQNKEQRKEYNLIHREEKKKYMKIYRVEHKEELLTHQYEYRRKHPEIYGPIRIKHETARNLHVVAWTDWDNIKDFYKNCPKGMEVDHIAPLQGELISGLHVSWNLQYLIPPENRSKHNKCNILEVSERYGKYLKEVSLK